MSRHYALVPAAGNGARFGSPIPKQYLELAGRPMIHHSLAALCRCGQIETVWVILSPGDEWWGAYDWSCLAPKLQVLFCGGATRAESVGNGLRAVSDLVSDHDWMLVHDAARPCLSQAMLNELCEELRDDPVGGLLAVPVADTLKRADADRRVAVTESREGLWQAQTPQMFRYGLLRKSLAGNHAVTDEASAMEAAGYQPRLVKADATNFKVTFPADLRLAELVLQGKKS